MVLKHLEMKDFSACTEVKPRSAISSNKHLLGISVSFMWHKGTGLWCIAMLQQSMKACICISHASL